MVSILGINAFHGDSSAALVIDGRFHYALDGRELRGTVKFFNRNSGKGQIDARGPHEYIPFFVDVKSATILPHRGEQVLFTLSVTELGIRAHLI